MSVGGSGSAGALELFGSQGRKAEAVALAWEQYLREQGMEQRFLFVAPSQVAQLNWECGLLTIVRLTL